MNFDDCGDTILCLTFCLHANLHIIKVPYGKKIYITNTWTKFYELKKKAFVKFQRCRMYLYTPQNVTVVAVVLFLFSIRQGIIAPILLDSATVQRQLYIFGTTKPPVRTS